MTTPTPTLSPRQWQILALLAEGKQNKEIAGHLAPDLICEQHQ